MARKKKQDFDAAAAERMTAAEIAAYMDERERRFAEEYLVDLNGTQAAIRAGYKAGRNNASAAVTASRLLRDERVQLYRSALIRESVEDMDISRDALVLKLLEIYRRCMAAEPVMQWDSGTKEWRESGVWNFDAKGAMKALEQLSKLLGFDAPMRIDAGGEGLEALLGELRREKSY